MGTELIELCEQWQKWASAADQSEDGWQSDFPRWSALISAACAAMTDPQGQHTFLAQIELCWRISAETEDMPDFAKEQVADCWPVLVLLAQSEFAEVRWQVYSVLPLCGSNAEPLLRVALHDLDAYCKRRALLSLAFLHPKDSMALKARFIRDTDPYIRRAAEEFKVS